jgi:hypothetical protein
MNQAYDFVRSVINIGTAKLSTLALVSLRSIQIDNAGAVELINSLGSVMIDLSDNGLGTMYQVFVSPQARLVGLNCSKDPFYSALWWTAFPQFLCDLDCSNLNLTNCNHPDLFQPLTSALASSPVPLALQSVDISFVVVSPPQSVVRFLEVCLLCPMIQLKKLDISGDLPPFPCPHNFLRSLWGVRLSTWRSCLPLLGALPSQESNTHLPSLRWAKSFNGWLGCIPWLPLWQQEIS